MECIFVRDSENCGIRDNKTKGDKMEMGSSMGSGPRKRLADISNLPHEFKPSSQHENLKSSSLATNQYNEQLRKENIALMKVVAERNKVIELSGFELQKLRINVQRLHQQNVQLTKANSQMSAELNSGKDKQKALHHELGCKNALLHAIKLELEEKTNFIMSQITGKESKVEIDKCEDARESSQVNNGDVKLCTTKRRRQSKKPSLDPAASEPVERYEKIDNERYSLRRPKRFKSEEADPPEEPELDLGPTVVKPLKAKDNKRQSARLKCDEAEPSGHLPKIDDDAKPIEAEEKVDNKRQSARLKCDEPEPSGHLSEIDDDAKPIEAEEKVDNKRSSLRKKPMRFKSKEPEVVDTMSDDPEPALGIHCSTNVKPLIAKQNKRHSTKKQPVRANSGAEFHLEHKSIPPSSVKKEDEERNSIGSDKAQELARPSTGRPLRQSVAKIQSFKEVPLNVKMRRPG